MEQILALKNVHMLVESSGLKILKKDRLKNMFSLTCTCNGTMYVCHIKEVHSFSLKKK